MLVELHIAILDSILKQNRLHRNKTVIYITYQHDNTLVVRSGRSTWVVVDSSQPSQLAVEHAMQLLHLLLPLGAIIKKQPIREEY